MVSELTKTHATLYEADYSLWLEDTIQKLQSQAFDTVDWENLIEEIASLGRSEKRRLESLLTRLFEHLLKLTYWQNEREPNRGHWEGEIINFRKQINKELKASPSLKNYLSEIFDDCYQDGRDIAAKRSQLPLETFPVEVIGSLEQILDEDWLP
jgi:hypothetical protein